MKASPQDTTAARDRLRHELELLEAASRIARIGGWSVDAKTRAVAWSEQVFHIHEIDPAHGPPGLRTALSFYEEQARGRLAAALERALTHGEPIHLQLPFTSACGRPIWVQVEGRAELDTDGAVSRVIGTFQDVTERRRAELALRESEDRYRGIFDHANDVILLISLEGTIVDANPMACGVYGYPRDELVGKHGSEFVHPDHFWKFEDAIAAVRAGRQYTAESVDLRRGGEAFPIEVRISPFRHQDRPVMLCSIRDISERRRAEALMREALVVFNASSQAIMVTDDQGVIVSVNPAFCRITGYPVAEAVGRSASMLASGRRDAQIDREMRNALRSRGSWEGEIWNRRRNGEEYPQWQSVSAVRDSSGKVVEYVALFNDITQRIQQEEAVWRQANFDALTGLANRRLFQDRLERAMAEARREKTKVGLLFLDLDGFKWINDTMGHEVGDRLLGDVARRLKTCVRDRDTVARFGGDEFTIVVHDVRSSDDLHQVGEKVVASLHEPFVLAGSLHVVTGSVGITVFPDDGDDVQALLRNADIAMYKSKQAGRDRFQFYAPHMQSDALARMQMETELRLGLRENRFELHYQPIVDADGGALVAAEALLRWRHPVRGLLPAQAFVGVAEDSGLIQVLGEWALREAARQCAAWRDAGHDDVRIAVNVSAAQLRDDALAPLIAELVDRHAIEPGRLLLEISESQLMEGSKSSPDRMAQIRRSGVGYALDHFGAGLPSLAFLKKFAVALVKIDRSFVAACTEDADSAQLVEAIIGMAHSLGLRVTAEGVESEAQLIFLRDIGCDHLQGWLVGEPLPAAEFEALLGRPSPLRAIGGNAAATWRMLAALQQGESEVEGWLREQLARPGDVSLPPPARDPLAEGLDLRAAIDFHLACRRRLIDAVLGEASHIELDLRCAGHGEACAIGGWIQRMHGRADPCVVRLEAAHRDYHQITAAILTDLHLGLRDEARRRLTGVQFRRASHDVLAALIDCFRVPAG